MKTKIFTIITLCAVILAIGVNGLLLYTGYINVKYVYLNMECIEWLSFENNMINNKNVTKDITDDVAKYRAKKCKQSTSFEYYNNSFIFEFEHKYNEEDFK